MPTSEPRQAAIVFAANSMGSLAARGPPRLQVAAAACYGLTFHELTVLCLVAAGLADKEIAFRLGTSSRTASKHVENTLSKMNTTSRAEAGVRAIREGLVEALEQGQTRSGSG